MITEKAYAKLNLTLSITGRLPDGYHSLETVMQTISLCDDVAVRKSDTVRVSCGALSGANNLAYKAARAFFDHTGINGGADIAIEKRIPVCGGFGGGSADAAAVLRALDSLYGARLGEEGFCRIALTLGADVPFLVKGGTALCTGKGENIRRLICKTPLYYCVCAPAEGASTARMFAESDKYSFYIRQSGAMADALQNGDPFAAARALHNDFTDICGSLFPSTVMCRAALMTCGALGVSLTGSGSGCFGIFADEASAKNAETALKNDFYAVFAQSVV